MSLSLPLSLKCSFSFNFHIHCPWEYREGVAKSPRHVKSDGHGQQHWQAGGSHKNSAWNLIKVDKVQ